MKKKEDEREREREREGERVRIQENPREVSPRERGSKRERERERERESVEKRITETASSCAMTGESRPVGGPRTPRAAERLLLPQPDGLQKEPVSAPPELDGQRAAFQSHEFNFIAPQSRHWHWVSHLFVGCSLHDRQLVPRALRI